MAPLASVWNHNADKDLLLAIIDEGSSFKWPTISDKMKAKGYTFTKEACRQHFQKIRKESRNSTGGSDGGSSPVRPAPFKAPKPSMSNKSTPRKAKSMTDSFSIPNSSFSTNNGSFSTNNGSFATSYDNGNGYGQDEEEEMKTPAKRQRTMKWEENGGQSAPTFKIERAGGERKPVDLENHDLYHEDENSYA